MTGGSDFIVEADCLGNTDRIMRLVSPSLSSNTYAVKIFCNIKTVI